MFSWRYGQTGGTDLRDDTSRATPRTMTKLRAATRGHTKSLALYQEAAVRLKRGHTRNGRHHPGSDLRRHGLARSKLGIEMVPQAARIGQHAVGFLVVLDGDRRGHDERGRGGSRGQGAIRHAARAGLTFATTAHGALRLRGGDRLHLRKGGTEGDQQEPDEAFHAKGTLPAGVRQATGYSIPASGCEIFRKKCILANGFRRRRRARRTAPGAGWAPISAWPAARLGPFRSPARPRAWASGSC